MEADHTHVGSGKNYVAGCPDCKLLGRQARAAHVKRNLTDTQRQSRRAMWKRQGMDPDDAEAIWLAGGGCFICGSEHRLAVDHDHSTGRIRGLLCGNCNMAIGLLGDDTARLRAAIAYLSPKE